MGVSHIHVNFEILERLDGKLKLQVLGLADGSRSRVFFG